MNKKPTLSVIIPCYNCELYIKECLMSLLKQEAIYNLPRFSMEIICVDDGSTDKTLEILEKAAKGSNIKVFSIPHVGPYKAREYGFQKSSGQYIHFMDADDKLKENTYLLTVGCMQYHNLDLVIFGGVAIGDAESKCIAYNTHYKVSPEIRGEVVSGVELMQQMATTGNFFVGLPFRIFKRELVEACWMQKPSCEALYHADNFYSFMAMCHAEKAMAFSQPFYIRRVTPNSISNAEKQEKEHFKSIMYVLSSLMSESEGLNKSGEYGRKYITRLFRAITKRCTNLSRGQMEKCVDEMDALGENNFVWKNFIKFCIVPHLWKEIVGARKANNLKKDSTPS